MRRREFIWLLGGGATAWPLSVRSQQAELRRIGVLMNLAANDQEGKVRLAGYRNNTVLQIGITDLGEASGYDRSGFHTSLNTIFHNGRDNI